MMETITIENYDVTTFRKNTPKFVQEMRNRACHLLAQGNNIEETYNALRQHLKDIGYNGHIYVAYWPVNDWNKKDSLSIRNSSGDYTLVSIKSTKEELE